MFPHWICCHIESVDSHSLMASSSKSICCHMWVLYYILHPKYMDPIYQIQWIYGLILDWNIITFLFVPISIIPNLLIWHNNNNNNNNNKIPTLVVYSLPTKHFYFFFFFFWETVCTRLDTMQTHDNINEHLITWIYIVLNSIH